MQLLAGMPQTQPQTRDALCFPRPLRSSIDAYLPNESRAAMPFVTLTYACSMDSMISIIPGQPTPISGPQSKAMTHYLRSKHDAIVVGVGTAIADNPTLNTRLEDIAAHGLQYQPQPVILDRNARWEFTKESKVIVAAKEGKGKAPWVLVDAHGQERITEEQRQTLHECGGKYISCPPGSTFMEVLHQHKICSIMVEGGAFVINDMLNNHRKDIDSVIITIGPQLFGRGGVHVSPHRRVGTGTEVSQPALKFKNVQWVPLDQDVVMCGKIVPT